MRKIVRHRILKRDHFKCQNCGAKENLQIDHILPLCRGGRHNEDNMQVLCRTCNCKKGRSIDFQKYFKIGIDKEYILMRRDFPIGSVTPKENQQIMIEMHRKNDEIFDKKDEE